LGSRGETTFFKKKAGESSKKKVWGGVPTRKEKRNQVPIEESEGGSRLKEKSA